MDSVAKWFKNLSAGAKVAIIAAGLIGTGALAATGQPDPYTPIKPTKVDAAETLDAHVTKQPIVSTEFATINEPIPFQKKTQNDTNLASGTTKLITVGVNGVNTKTFKVTKTDGVETQRELTKEEVTTAPIDELISVGTYVAPVPESRSTCDPNYTPCIPLVSYDLDCADIGFTVQVIGYDKHRLDRDKDGLGCE